MTSQNGWPTSGNPSAIGVKSFVVHGVSFPGGVKSGDVAVVLGYVLDQFHRRVEPLHPGWCWGYAYRPIRGRATLSNHSSGTAADANAPDHPLGKRGTFTRQQVAEIHAILAEVDRVVRWGGDYSGRADEMHFEINAGAEAVARVARRIGPGQEDDVTPEQAAQLQRIEDNQKLILTYLGSKDPDAVGKAVGRGDILSDVDFKVALAKAEGFNHKTGKPPVAPTEPVV